MRVGPIAVVLWLLQVSAAIGAAGPWQAEVLPGVGRRLVRGDVAAVPARLIVKVVAADGMPGARAAAHVLDALARRLGAVPRPLLPEGVLASARRTGRARASFDAAGLRRLHLLDVAGGDAEAMARACRALSGVEWCELDRAVTASFAPDDPYLATSGRWGQPFADL